MSYVTYSPDVQAPVTDKPLRSKRVLWWLVGLGIYALFCIALIWWLAKPPPVQPPLASISLPGGTELRLLDYRSTEEIELNYNEDFGGRLIMPDYYNRGYGRTSWGRLGSPGVASPWLIFSQFDPKTKKFHLPMFQDFQIIEEGTGVDLTAKVFHGATDLPVAVTAFTALPRRQSHLTVRLRHEGTWITGKIPNPFVSAAQPFVAKPLPHRVEVDGIAFELRGIKLGRGSKVINGVQAVRYQPTPDLKVYALAAPNAQLGTRWSFFDATGNESGQEMLPATDGVWGLRVTAHEFPDFPFPPEQVLSLGTIKAPGPGQAISLPVHPSLQEYGVVGVFAMGAGSYNLSCLASGQAQILNATGGTSTPIATLQLKRPFNTSITTQHLGLWTILETRGSPNHPGEIRILRAGTSVLSIGGGTSSNGNIEARLYSFDGAQKKLPVGEDIEIQFIYRKERKVEFYFERPKLPGEK